MFYFQIQTNLKVINPWFIASTRFDDREQMILKDDFQQNLISTPSVLALHTHVLPQWCDYICCVACLEETYMDIYSPSEA